ncbi:hypothetical protein ABW19_dt0209513 [Dactylella cylindrospora]|nr:hypothetical protein ABW19_dt0209513 [Dactylella cylindrospora]
MVWFLLVHLWLFFLTSVVIGGPKSRVAIASVESTPGIAIELSPADETDCSNDTHRWDSAYGSCLDEAQEPIPYSLPTPGFNLFGKHLGRLGLLPRDGLCGPEETTCWLVNCCQPGETCGPINIGCQVSWSTIYTTTITTSWSTITSIAIPTNNVEYVIQTVNVTAYVTSFRQLTLPGEGLDEIIETSVVTSSTLILSAFTPPPVTVTRTITQGLEATTLEQLQRRSERLLPRAAIPRRSARTSYKTLTVWVTTFYTTHTTASLSDSTVEYTVTSTMSSIATRNQTHYETPTGFTTSTIVATETTISYAYGSVDAPIRLFYVTIQPSSTIAGKLPTGEIPPPEDPPQASRQLSSGTIAGIVVGVILAIVLIGLIVGMLICVRRKRQRQRHDNFADTPSPPAAPIPQPIMTNVAQGTIIAGENAESPVSPISFVQPAAGKSSNLSSRHARKGSLASIISVTPVPEEDEEDDILPVNGAGARNSIGRDSSDSARSWGRGYGGRGGYYGSGSRARATRPKEVETESPTNPAFRGAVTSSYSDESLVPPHARDNGFRF